MSKYQHRYLTEEKFKSPVIVYNYPKAIKAFYMKVNEDNKTVAAMDVLVPKVLSPIHVSFTETYFCPLINNFAMNFHVSCYLMCFLGG